MHIARRASSGAFQQRDADALAALTGAIGRAIRASLRFDAARRITGVEAPGMVVLGPHDEVELITPPARELLASLRPEESGYTDETIAVPVLALASFVRSAPDGGQGGGNVVTVPGSDSWVTLHASLPGPPGDGRVAVVLERATTLLARGLSRAEMAEALVLSPHTVEDHVKSLYDKLGVASRQELVARVFLDEYLPEVVRQTPLTSRGRFDRG
ncbi:MAG: helix-turn-helix transcriptional regulator [Actinobacteria bacterium]|nr:MAG: helix-turn-helix transcriptional regulator [Actinomycetota bacterium]